MSCDCELTVDITNVEPCLRNSTNWIHSSEHCWAEGQFAHLYSNQNYFWRIWIHYHKLTTDI